MPLAPDIQGDFRVAIFDRNTNKEIIHQDYTDLNVALKAARSFVTSSPLRHHWFRLTVTDRNHVLPAGELAELVGYVNDPSA